MFSTFRKVIVVINIQETIGFKECEQIKRMLDTDQYSYKKDSKKFLFIYTHVDEEKDANNLEKKKEEIDSEFKNLIRFVDLENMFLRGVLFTFPYIFLINIL